MSTHEPSVSPEPMVTSSNVDLSNCDREQVQYPGAIQPHGVLLALREPELRLLQVSANVASLLEVEAEELLGRDLSWLFGQSQLDALRASLEGRALDALPERLMLLRRPGVAHAFEAHAHRRDGLLILELERVNRIRRLDPAALYGEVRQCVARLRAARSMQDLLDILARQVRALTGFDQVHVYEFMDDLSGLVRAESTADGRTPYLGLRFPASDVPAPARRLLSQLWVRHLPDVAYRPVPLVPELNPLSGEPLDLSFALLRSTSPLCNRFYLNMGVRATLILTLLKDGELWGFIGCLHPKPKVVPQETRAACESLAHMASFLIAAKEDADQSGEALAAKVRVDRIIEAMAREELYHLGLVRSGSLLLEAVEAQGALILAGEGMSRLGEALEETEVPALAAWLDTQPDLHATDRLPEVYPPAQSFKAAASGLLALRLPGRGGYLLWLRPEQPQDIRWAGNPAKPVEVDASNGLARLGPRRSFAVWEERVQGRSRPWMSHQLEAAASLGQAIRSLHEAERLSLANRALARSNQTLTRGNEELESFAYTAAHDLKEPLRGIGWHASQLRQDLDGCIAERERDRLDSIERLSQRMNGLIDALLHYSRVSRIEREPCAVDLGQLVSEALETLRPRLEETQAEVCLAPGLPTLRADPVQLHEIFLNLISNALKYNDSAQKRIEIGMRDGAEPLLFVKDNGIGIAPRNQEAIFGIFRRLHGRDSYGGGLGAGLAIVKQMIERQGGRIWVESTLGAGSTFVFSLPGAHQRSQDAGGQASSNG